MRLAFNSSNSNNNNSTTAITEAPDTAPPPHHTTSSNLQAFCQRLVCCKRATQVLQDDLVDAAATNNVHRIRELVTGAAFVDVNWQDPAVSTMHTIVAHLPLFNLMRLPPLLHMLFSLVRRLCTGRATTGAKRPAKRCSNSVLTAVFEPR